MVSEVMGRVQELHVKEGDPVKQGDLLLRLDPATVQAEVDAAGGRAAAVAPGHRAPAGRLDTLETKLETLPAAARSRA